MAPQGSGSWLESSRVHITGTVTVKMSVRARAASRVRAVAEAARLLTPSELQVRHLRRTNRSHELEVFQTLTDAIE
jgi:hypothetical protein